MASTMLQHLLPQLHCQLALHSLHSCLQE